MISHSASDKAKAIAEYTAAGYTLFPCNNPKNAKAPRWKRWQETAFTTTPDLPSIYAVLLDETDFVLDFDPRRGDTQLVDLFRSLGLPRQETFMVETQSGGYHVYYKKDPELKFGATVPGFPAIEIKSKGKYVVAYGSVFEKRKYTAFRHSPLIVLPAPPELIAVCKPRLTSTTTHAGLEDFDDSEGNQKRFIDFLNLPSVSSKGAYAVACEGVEYGLSPNAILDLMMEHYNPKRTNPRTEEEIQVKIDHAFEYAQSDAGSANPALAFEERQAEAAQNEDAKPAPLKAVSDLKWEWTTEVGTGNRIYKPTLNNAVNMFQLTKAGREGNVNPLHKLVRYNEFTNVIELNHKAPWHKVLKAEWRDSDTVMLKLHLARTNHLDVSETIVHQTITAAAQMNSYHPVKQYLEPLEWDGTKRLDRLLPDYFGTVDTDYAAAIGKNMMIAAVARVLDPGCKFDYMVVLEGKQGTGKSQAVSILGGEFYVDMLLDPKSKDTVQAMHRGWIIELAEMEFTNHADVKALKSFISRQSDVVRMPYDKFTGSYPRQSIFIGTTNPDTHGYLRDTTGNRRFWPIWTNEIDLKGLKRDRDQLFAEAKARYEANEVFYIDDPEVAAAAVHESMSRVDSDIWEGVIKEYIAKTDGAITTVRIGYEALNIDYSQLNRTVKIRIGNVLGSMGYTLKSAYDKETKTTVKQWVRDI